MGSDWPRRRLLFPLIPDTVTFQDVFHHKIHEQERNLPRLKGTIESLHVLVRMPS